MSTTITIESPALVGTLVNGRVVISQESPLRMVTRTITGVDDQTVLAYAQRIANLAQWDPSAGDVAMPGLEATVKYWVAEAAAEAAIVAELAHAEDLETTAARFLGNVNPSIT
jgi:hypothetical protein